MGLWKEVGPQARILGLEFSFSHLSAKWPWAICFTPDFLEEGRERLMASLVSYPVSLCLSFLN